MKSLKNCGNSTNRSFIDLCIYSSPAEYLYFYLDMKARLFVAALLALILTANSLHIQGESNLIHLQTSQDKEAYLKSLLKIQEQLLVNVESLQKSVHANNDKLNQF